MSALRTWVVISCVLCVCAHAKAQRKNGYCREEPALVASTSEKALGLPYCRSKVGATTIQQRETPLYWASDARRIEIVPYVENLKFATTLYPGPGFALPSTMQIERVLAAIRKAAATWNKAAASDFNGRRCSDLEIIVLDPPTEPERPPTNRYTTSKVIEGVDHKNIIAWRTGLEGDQWKIDCSKITDTARRTSCAFRGEEKELYAVTQSVFNTSTGEVIDSDISFNGENYVWAVIDNATPELLPGQVLSPNCTEQDGELPEECIGVLAGAADVQAVVTHELGHLIGFAHVIDEDKRSIMNFANTNRRTLTAADIQGLCETYPPGRPTPFSYSDEVVTDETSGGCAVSDKPICSSTSLWVGLMYALMILRRGKMRFMR